MVFFPMVGERNVTALTPLSSANAWMNFAEGYSQAVTTRRINIRTTIIRKLVIILGKMYLNSSLFSDTGAV